MSDEIILPQLIVRNDKSEFRLRCHAAAWAGEYGGRFTLHRRHTREFPGLLLLSATGSDTAVKAVRATLYQPSIDAMFNLADGNGREMIKARSTYDGKPVSYNAAVSKLAPGVIHLVALAMIPGLMPNMSDDHLWTELSSPRYTTPLLRSWIPWLKRTLVSSGGIVACQGISASVGVLRTEGEELDALVATGVKKGHLRMVA
jgi:hypothetical protein